MSPAYRAVMAIIVISILAIMSIPLTAVTNAKSESAADHGVISLSGSGDEVWQAFGEVAAESISKNLERFWKTASESHIRRGELVAAALKAEALLPRDYVNDVKALSKGAGVPYPETLAFNVMGGEVTYRDECTVFVATGSGSLNHETMIAKDRDVYSTYTQVLVVVTPSKGYAYVGVTSAGQVGIAFGMNQKGVTIADTSLPAPANDPVGYSTYTVMEHVLKESNNVSSAISIVDNMPKFSGAMYAIGNETEAAMVETVPTIYSPDITYQIVRDDVAYHSNHYVFQPYYSWVLDGSFGTVSPASYCRYDRAAELAASANDTVSKNDLMAFLRDVKNFGVYARKAVIEAHPEVPLSCWATAASGYSIDNNRTRSATVLVTDPQRPEFLSTMWLSIANPSFSPFVPVHNSLFRSLPSVIRVFSQYMNGTAWNCSKALQNSNSYAYGSLDGTLRSFEASIQGSTEMAKQRALNILGAGYLKAASSVLAIYDARAGLDGLSLLRSLVPQRSATNISSSLEAPMTLGLPRVLSSAGWGQTARHFGQ